MNTAIRDDSSDKLKFPLMDDWAPVKIRRIARLRTEPPVVLQVEGIQSSKIGLEHIESGTGKIIDHEVIFTGEGTWFERRWILYGKLRPYLAKVALAPFAGTAVGDFHVLQPSEKIVPEFLQLFLLSDIATKTLTQSSHGAKMPRVSWNALANLVCLVPSKEAQCAVVNFLETEITRIDTLIDKQKELIELLKEKRQTVISHAVTKGSDPDVPMKDSGVEWLGEIPKHWAVSRLKFSARRVVVGIAEAATHAYADSGVPILRATNVRAGRFIGNILYVNREYAMQPERSGKLLRSGDLVTVRTGNAGVTAVLPDELDGCHCFTMLVTSLLPGLCNEFAELSINSVAARSYFALEGWGSAQANISVPILKNMTIALPPRDEQDEIVRSLKMRMEAIDQIMRKAEAAIALFQERRSALITAAVTGQIDVTNYTPSSEPAAA